MPRVGLSTAEVVKAGAEMADEVGAEAISLTALAHRFGVKPPALYKHVDGINDLQHRIATLVMTEIGDILREHLQGLSGVDAITAVFETVRGYVTQHPGRYRLITGAVFGGPCDPLRAATLPVVDAMREALAGYALNDGEADLAIQTLRCLFDGFAQLRTMNAFQWSNDPQRCVQWMIRFVDAGLRGIADSPRVTSQ